MKKILTLIMAISISGSIFAAKIATISTQKVFQGYSKAQSAKTKLLDEKNKLEGQLSLKAKSLDKVKKELIAKGKKVTEAEADKYKKQEMELSKEYQALQQKLSRMEYEEMVPIQTEIKSAINQVARKNKYEMVVEESAVLYGGEDITAEVLKSLENSKKIKL